MATGKWRQKGDPLILKDRLLWEMVCRTIIPLHNQLHSPLPEEAANVDHENQRVAQIYPFFQENQQRPITAKKEKEPVAQAHTDHSFDRIAHRKIAKGRYPIDAHLDLHGYTQEEAYFFLKNFLKSSQQNGLRYVLVITGKGRSHGSDGVLSHFVPHWLSTPAFRYYVHEFGQAARQHGGGGALYVRLRRSVLR
ncbi:Smr/MutS family protein [Bartonella sp. CB60]|uniref:Smr/MutS family protein n=1 Tax=Bartonella sp. CB60 TaxID=3113619 RepID=UPI00300DF70E